MNGKKVAEGSIDDTVPSLFSADDTSDVGVTCHTPVAPEHAQHGNEFSGTTREVTIELQ